MAEITALHPRLVVDDAAAAIDFYRTALGAEETARYTNHAGRIVHAEITIGGATVAIKDEGDGDPAPTTLGGTPVIMAVTVVDVDTAVAAMIDAGASVVHPAADRDYGQRDARLVDPFGHLWLLSQYTEDLPPVEIQRPQRSGSVT